MATQGEAHFAGGSYPLVEETQRTMSTSVTAPSRVGRSGQEPKRALTMWCNYNKWVWYMDWACEHASNPLKPRCGAVLFIHGRDQKIHLVGSITAWAYEDDDIIKFYLRKLYRRDGSVDEHAKGCMVSWKRLGGYGGRAATLQFFVPMMPGEDVVVHLKDFLEVWVAKIHPNHDMDLPPQTSISNPIAAAGGDRPREGARGEGQPSTPLNPVVGMSDDSEEECTRAPLKVVVQEPCRRGLGEQSPGRRVRQSLEKAPRDTSPHCVSKTVIDLVRSLTGGRHHSEKQVEKGKQMVASLSDSHVGGSVVREACGTGETTLSVHHTPLLVDTKASPRRDASGNVALEEEEMVDFETMHQSPSGTPLSGGKGIGQTPKTQERGSVQKRKRGGGGEETPKEPSRRRKTGESSGKGRQPAKGRITDEGPSGGGDSDVEVNKKNFDLDKAFFLEMKTGVQKDVVLYIHPERILPIPDWEDAYNHHSLDDFLMDGIVQAMVEAYNVKDKKYTKLIFVLAPIVAPPEKNTHAECVLPDDFDVTTPERYWYYPVSGQHNAAAAMNVKDYPMFKHYSFGE
ncbi:hypothetical protein CBR_g3940 [Chara braunii]|uniref:Uncharacterized protein n=1 Tax=Chara braunii TaxID=69332 RepID=A0A388KGS4_CHABU|nr:hypothetical protein CBR_g3940 [Chara braunii]|eukprot:GBG69241.1 hypothetical protein CBR_g3940 [Chara braunii]